MDWNWPLVLSAAIAMLGWLIAGSRAVLGDRYHIGERVETLEVLQAEYAKRLERIENKLDRLLEEWSSH